MFFNFRYPIILFILSLAGLMIGMAFKVMHWPGGQMITGSMIMVQVIAIIWLLIIVIKTPR
ncbi:hypothetical protein KXD93_27920 [Mucilaginibacter sp. BJC16-A38]|uniref:hypothetical protein n=1 Tax=Mucilaginibacter phenanthrenivorans TaxID=1234842 RepID=UPI002158163E|nr:hypothetical protein [Mucilaginibacter phenanthrenivorans]MCR8561514.1 hypothetical protein [Mucilaginibacter phenanthrenivorans]